MSVSFGDTPTSNPSRKLPTPEEAHRIARAHACSLQIRKALEASVLDSLTYLLDLPSSSAPTRDEARAFKHHLRYFSPTDYDELIQERNIILRCGYVLCAKETRKSKVQSRFARARDGNWVERRALERFCRDDCARKALWVRVQLATEPAWMRHEVVGEAEVDNVTGKVTGIDLLAKEPPRDWDEKGCGIRLLEESEELKKWGTWTKANENDVRKLAEDLEGIGIKDVGGLVKIESTKGKDPSEVLVDVVEREAKEKVVIKLPGDDDDNEDATAAIEGYVPKLRRRGA